MRYRDHQAKKDTWCHNPVHKVNAKDQEKELSWTTMIQESNFWDTKNKDCKTKKWREIESTKSIWEGKDKGKETSLDKDKGRLRGNDKENAKEKGNDKGTNIKKRGTETLTKIEKGKGKDKEKEAGMMIKDREEEKQRDKDLTLDE